MNEWNEYERFLGTRRKHSHSFKLNTLMKTRRGKVIMVLLKNKAMQGTFRVKSDPKKAKA